MNNVKNWLLGTAFLVSVTTAILVAFSPESESMQSATTISPVFNAY